MRRQLSILSLVVLSAVALSACGSGSVSVGPFGTKSASQIMSLAKTAMTRAGSVHVDEVAAIPGSYTLTTTIDASLKAGMTSQTFNGTVTELRFVNSKLFLFANAKTFSKRFTRAKQSLANQWIEIPSTNTNFAAGSQSILLASIIGQTMQMSNIKLKGIVSYLGQRAVAIEGKTPAGSGTVSSSETLYISTAKPYLPLAVVAELNQGTKTGSGTVTFTKWGNATPVVAPASYITVSAKDFP